MRRLTFLFPDCCVATVGKRTRLAGTETCDIELVATEVLGNGLEQEDEVSSCRTLHSQAPWLLGRDREKTYLDLVSAVLRVDDSPDDVVHGKLARGRGGREGGLISCFDCETGAGL
jgi:hypothetical protein